MVSRDRLDDVERFADALEQGTGALVVRVYEDGDWVRVQADVPTGAVNEAQTIASAHGFRLGGGVGSPGPEGTRRYEFSAKGARLDTARGAFDWDLPGGVR